MIKEMDIRKLVKYFIVKNPLYDIGLNDTLDEPVKPIFNGRYFIIFCLMFSHLYYFEKNIKNS